MDRLASAIAREQHGLVARRQLLAIGFSGRAVERRIERGVLHPVHRGVYALGFRLRSKEARWMAAVLACGPDAVLSHRSAVRLWGLSPGSSRAIEVTRRDRVEAARRRWSSTAPRYRDDERTVVDGIPVTTVPRTVLDYAVEASRREVERALNEMEVRQLRDALSIPDLLERYPRRRGSAVVRELLDRGAEACGESRSGSSRSGSPPWSNARVTTTAPQRGHRGAGSVLQRRLSVARSALRRARRSCRSRHAQGLRERPRARPADGRGGLARHAGHLGAAARRRGGRSLARPPRRFADRARLYAL